MRKRLPSFPSVPIVRFSVSQGLVNASVRSDGVSCDAGASVLDRYGIALFIFFTHLANTQSPMYWYLSRMGRYTRPRS